MLLPFQAGDRVQQRVLGPPPPLGPLAPSSKTKRAMGGAECDARRGRRARCTLLVRVPKSKKKKGEWKIDALSTKFKVDFCLGPEVTGSNSSVADP